MSARMQLPLSQQRHSNVATVRLIKNGVRLEIACYKNKVVSFRSGLETRLDEVLQIDRVFTNVSRGSYASLQDIRKALGEEADEASALTYILEHGDVQVAQQERSSEQDDMMKDIATIISQKCVHSVTKRPFPVGVIEQALHTIGAVVKPDQPAKKQALLFIHALVSAQVIPIQRAMMKLRAVAADSAAAEAIREWVRQCGGDSAQLIERGGPSTSPPAHVPLAAEALQRSLDAAPEQDAGASSEAAAAVDRPQDLSVEFLLAPHLFRDADAFVKQISRGSSSGMGAVSSLHVIETSVAETGEGAALDLEALVRHADAALASPAIPHLQSTPTAGAGQKGKKKPSDETSTSTGGGGGEERSATSRSHGDATATRNGSKKTKGDSKSSKQQLSKHKGSPSDSDAEGEDSRRGEPVLLAVNVGSDDDDDGGAKRRKKSAANKAKKPQQLAAKKPVAASKLTTAPANLANASEDEDDVVSERKKRKQQQHGSQSAHSSNNNPDDDVDFEHDYGDEDEAGCEG